jgi:predicted dehydrogenase
LRVGILGFGYTGRLHLQAWQQSPAAKVIGIADHSPAARALAPPAIPVLASCSELLALRPDAVSICLPTACHHAATLEALASGAHVLLEKPIAATVDHACEMILAAAAARRTLFVGMTHRFYPEVLAARRLVDEGAIGEIVLFRDCVLEHFGFIDAPRWYLDPAIAGGGTLLTSGIHLIDRVIWFAGEMPVSVIASGGNRFLHQAVEDAAQIFLSFPSGRSAQLSLGLLAEPHPLVCDLELIGTRGSILVHTWRGYELRTARGTERHDVYSDERHTDKVLVGVRGEVDEFCSAVQEGRQPRPGVEESTRALRVVHAAYRSMTSGSVVTIP